jgi:KUP system potassium uptake protein
VFLTPDVDRAPLTLLHHFRHNHVLASPASACGLASFGASYGFMERPDVQHVVATCCEHGMAARPGQVTYYLGRARLLPGGLAPMMRWRKQLFAFMSWNASSATDFFGIPPDRVVELGARLEL